MRIVLAGVVVSSVAAADPHAEFAVRAGANWVTTDSNLELAPGGRGLCLDGEVAYRAGAFSVSVFAAYTTFRAHTYANDQDEGTTTDARFHFLDVGWRASLHGEDGHAGPIVGIGLAAEGEYESGRKSVCYCQNNFCDPCTTEYTNQPYTHQNLAPMFELHIGATLPKIGRFAPEILGILGWSLNPDADGGLETKRIVIGTRF